MKHLKLIVFFALTSFTLLSMQQRYSKRKQPEVYSSIIPDRKELKNAFLATYIDRHGDKKLKNYNQEIQNYMDRLEESDTLYDRGIKKTVSHHLKECGMEHKQVFLVHKDDGASVQKPHCSDLDDIVVLALNTYEDEKSLQFLLLHELGHLKHKHLLDLREDKKHNHKQEFTADRFAKKYFLERKEYISVISGALWFLARDESALLKDSFTHPCNLKRAQKQLDSLHVHVALQNKTIADILEEEESLSSLDRILIKKTINQHFPSRYFH